MTSAPDLTRRTFLAGLSTAYLAGSASTVAAQEGRTHTIDMTDDLVFDPDELTIAPGDTVVWENVGQIGHTVTAYEDEIPGEARYFASGDFDDESAARSAYTVGDPASGDIAGGGSYEHTFEIEGSYGYFCVPHESVGMVASISVEPGGPPENGEGGGPQIPDAARNLLIGVLAVLASALALTYILLKYGGSPPQE